MKGSSVVATGTAASSTHAAHATAVSAIESHREELITLSKFIHDHPEIAAEEFESSKACADFLERLGFQVERGVAGLPTAFEATAGSGEGPTIAFLSEYDALPGLGHGCGHNLIAIAGVAAGLGLKAAMEAHGIPGRVKVFGTPAEESVGGKIIMADAGLFDGVDAAMGAHPGTSEAVCPTVEGSGRSLACQDLRIEFVGKAAHAAADPFDGINALNALIETFNGTNALRQHVKSDARIHGIITDGGKAANVVPDFAAGSFMIRAATLTYMEELVEKVRKIAEGAALMTGATLNWVMTEKANSDMITNYTLARQVKANLDAVGLQLPEAKPEEPTGSTDWGNVSYHVPSVETSFPIMTAVCTWHSPEVVAAADSELGYQNTLLVAQAMARTGVDLLLQPDLLNAVKDEFARSPAVAR
jgi:amidohydrolase